MACSQTAPNRFDWSKHAPAWLVRTYRLSASLDDLFSGLHMLYRLPFQDPDVIGFVRATRKRLAHNAVAVGTCSVQSRVVTVLVDEAWRPPIPPSKCRGTNSQIFRTRARANRGMYRFVFSQGGVSPSVDCPRTCSGPDSCLGTAISGGPGTFSVTKPCGQHCGHADGTDRGEGTCRLLSSARTQEVALT